MTNKNSNWKNRPFLLQSAGKDYLWGGSRLKEEFGKELDCSPLAETWECSTHPDGPSTVAEGPNQGKSLTEVLQEHPEYLGTHPRTRGELPILVKLIDAGQDLSIQVHPDDDYARIHENGSLGKVEMWYVVDTIGQAGLIYGFRHDMSKEILWESLEKGTIEKYLQKIPVKKDDVFFVEAGTVHALGAGTLVVEVQENSNITYRLYDYERQDKNGRKRPLHLERAMDVVNLKGSAEPRQPMRVLRYRPGWAAELLCRCKYFQVERWLVHTEGEKCFEKTAFRTGHNSFQVLLCVEGSGNVVTKEGDSIPYKKGSCIFIPADSIALALQGKAQLLNISC